MHSNTHTDQLLTCINVKFVCAAICRFSSSVGYGCCTTMCQYTSL